ASTRPGAALTHNPGWSSFGSKSRNIRLQYPSSWKANQYDESSVTFLSLEPPANEARKQELTIDLLCEDSFPDLPPKKIFEGWLLHPAQDKSFKVVSAGKIRVDGMEAWRGVVQRDVFGKPGMLAVIVVNHAAKDYTIKLEGALDDATKVLPDFDRIVD